MPVYLTPGIYRSPIPPADADIRLVRTDVAGFIGYAERGPLPGLSLPGEPLAVRLTSWKEFQATFGGLIQGGYLAYAVRGFFENGGTTCYVVRVAAADRSGTTGPQIASSVLLGNQLSARQARAVTNLRAPALSVSARSAGSWGNRLRLTVSLIGGASRFGDFALRVVLEAGLDASLPREEEYYNHLSLDEASAFYAPDRINAFSNLIRVKVNDESKLPASEAAASVDSFYLKNGQDGLADVKVLDFTGDEAAFPDAPRGLRLLQDIDEIAILCAPDAVFREPATLSRPPLPPADPCAPPADSGQSTTSPQDRQAGEPPDTAIIFRAMIDQCERLRYRVAILDPPGGQKPSDVVQWKANYSTRFGALYYPWLNVPDALQGQGMSRLVPPSGHIAGVFANTDNLYGVQRPPANAALEFVTDVAEDISSLQQENLNPFGVNAVRLFPGRGIRVWGARSLAAADDGAWRFIHARRLMSMIEKSVECSTQWTVFEANDAALRRTLVHSLNVFLQTIWETGGLKGNTPAEGFYVKCDDTNNPQAVIDAGQIVCEVGVAIAAPMEFLIFTLRQAPDGVQIEEA